MESIHLAKVLLYISYLPIDPTFLWRQHGGLPTLLMPSHVCSLVNNRIFVFCPFVDEASMLLSFPWVGDERALLKIIVFFSEAFRWINLQTWILYLNNFVRVCEAIIIFPQGYYDLYWTNQCGASNEILLILWSI